MLTGSSISKKVISINLRTKMPTYSDFEKNKKKGPSPFFLVSLREKRGNLLEKKGLFSFFLIE